MSETSFADFGVSLVPTCTALPECSVMHHLQLLVQIIKFTTSQHSEAPPIPRHPELQI